MKCFAAILFLFAMIGAVRGAPHVDAETQLIFPEECGGWTKTAMQEYPEKELGFSIGYRREGDKTLTVYVYSRGYAKIPSGGENAIVAQNLHDTAADVVKAWTDRGGTVEEILPISEVRLSAGGRVQALLTAHRIKMPGGVMFSISGLTGYRGKLLKVRYTYSRHPLDEGFDDLARFVLGLVNENRATLDEFFVETPNESLSRSMGLPTRAEVDRAIEILEQQPLGTDALAAAAVVAAFAEKSEDVTIMLGRETTPWVLEGETSEEGAPPEPTMLLAIYLAGNMKAQLAAGRAEDAILAGWLAVLRAYPKFKHATGFTSASIDELARLQAAGELEGRADAVKAAPDASGGDAPAPEEPASPVLDAEPKVLRKVYGAAGGLDSRTPASAKVGARYLTR